MLQIARMECKGRIIIEKGAVEMIVEEKVRKILKKDGKKKEEAMEKLVEEKVQKRLKEDGKRKEQKIEELKEEVKRLKRKVERMEQSGGKKKRDDSEESRGKYGKRKWWAGGDERNNDKIKRRNVITRIEKERWEGKESNWEKVKKLLAESLKVKAEVREVSVVGQRRDWMTILVKLGDEEEKWWVLEVRRKAGNRVRVKIDEDKSV